MINRQWGNMLTLQAVYRSKLLKPLLMKFITEQELVELLEQTIGFLELNATPTSALAVDIRTLRKAGRRSGLLRSVASTSSFSSNSNFSS